MAGNSLGGFVALQLAARGRARSVVALAPAGGWPPHDPSYREMLEQFVGMHELAQSAAPFADELVTDPDVRRGATEVIVERYEHIPPELVAHLIVGVAGCEVRPLVDLALEVEWQLDAERIDCPVRLVWGTSDRVLPLPRAPRASARSGCLRPTGSSSTASATARSSTCRSSRPS